MIDIYKARSGKVAVRDFLKLYPSRADSRPPNSYPVLPDVHPFAFLRGLSTARAE